jgi:hypothetical protein
MAKCIIQGVALLSVVAFFFGTACSDDGTTTPTPTDIFGGELPTGDVTLPDTTTVDAGVDTAQPVDTAVPDVTVPDTAKPDVTKPDTMADNTPPTVTATNPTSEQGEVSLPFVVTVTFSEAIAANTIAPQTVRLIGPDDKDVVGERTLSADGVTLTFKPGPAEKLHFVAPYRMWLSGGIICDLAGNKLEENYETTFYTSDYPNTPGYKVLATQYAPTLHLATVPAVGNAQNQIPVAFDADGDWDGSNNQTWIQSGTKSVQPMVYYDVVESQTHYFIHYLYFYPWVNHPNNTYAHANGAIGAMVVVEKARGDVLQRPIGVTTYFKKGQFEEHYSYVTTESGIKGGESNKFYNLMGVYPQDELFPGGQYDALITAGRHESCLYLDKSLTLNCEFEVPYELIVKVSETPSVVTKGEAGWPKDMSELEGEPDAISYGLKNAITELWVRRNKVGPNHLWDGTFKYSSGDGQPGNGLELPSQFVDPLDDLDASFGRPMWAWRHNPSQGAIINLTNGQMGVDPAGYYMIMHKSINADTALVPFDMETGEGFSTAYCFNPILGIDNRDIDPACGADTP